MRVLQEGLQDRLILLNSSSGTGAAGTQTYYKFEILKNYLSEKAKAGFVDFATFTMPQKKISIYESWDILTYCIEEAVRISKQKLKRRGCEVEYIKDFEAHKSGYAHSHFVFDYSSDISENERLIFQNDVKNNYMRLVNLRFQKINIPVFKNNFSIVFKKANDEKIINYITKEIAKYRNIQSIYEREDFKKIFDKLEKLYEVVGGIKDTPVLIEKVIDALDKAGDLNDYEIKTIQTHFYAKISDVRVYEISRGLQNIINVFKTDTGRIDIEKVKFFNNEYYDDSQSFNVNIEGLTALDDMRDNSHREEQEIIHKYTIYPTEIWKIKSTDEARGDPVSDYVYYAHNISEALTLMHEDKQGRGIEREIELMQKCKNDVYNHQPFVKSAVPSHRNFLVNHLRWKYTQ